ncbi:MAG TPA: TonB family protein [Thermodesulfovibrionales bacterium]|nr:TonB family protein [Thermodesulfovibrionales bacterium]
MAKVAKREEKKHDSSITFDTNEFKYENYMMKLKSRIEAIWRYPQDAARRGLHGDLYIRFTIKKNGRLGDVEMVSTSGNPSLDNAAMQALKEGEPYWPLPDEWGKDTLTVTGHFVYSIYGTYIR